MIIFSFGFVANATVLCVLGYSLRLVFKLVPNKNQSKQKSIASQSEVVLKALIRKSVKGSEFIHQPFLQFIWLLLIWHSWRCYLFTWTKVMVFSFNRGWKSLSCPRNIFEHHLKVKIMNGDLVFYGAGKSLGNNNGSRNQ